MFFSCTQYLRARENENSFHIRLHIVHRRERDIVRLFEVHDKFPDLIGLTLIVVTLSSWSEWEARQMQPVSILACCISFLSVRLVSSHRRFGIVIFLLMPRPNEIARHSLTYTIQYEITVALQSYLSFSSSKWKRWQWRTDEISRARDTIDRARGSTMKSLGFQLSPCAALNISRLRSSRKSSQRR